MTRPKYPGKSPHGSHARYLWELKNGGSCPICRAAETTRTRESRDRRRERDAERALIAAKVSGITGVDIETLRNSQNAAILSAVRQDLDKADTERPGYATNAAMAEMLAKELDDDASKAAKGPLVKALGDVMREIFGTGGAGNDSFGALLDELASPLVPSEVLDTEGPDAPDSWD